MRSAFSATASGRVQLVMFRDFVQRTASRLSIVGVVKNMPNGTVHVYAEGERDVLDALIVRLKRGPLLARVDVVTVEWVHPSGFYNNFSIQY